MRMYCKNTLYKKNINNFRRKKSVYYMYKAIAFYQQNHTLKKVRLTVTVDKNNIFFKKLPIYQK